MLSKADVYFYAMCEIKNVNKMKVFGITDKCLFGVISSFK